MKRHIYTQVDYNLWANQRIIDLLSSLDSEVIDQPISNSFPTIKETLKHLQYAESIWLQRIQLDEHTSIPWPDTNPTAPQLYSDIIKGSNDLTEYVFDITKKDLNRKISFIPGEGSNLSDTIERILYHVVNHSTYHRGQVITMLKQLGIKEAVSTDLFFYYQET